MAADRVTAKKLRPVLVSKLEGCTDTIEMAMFVPLEDAVITVSADKSIRVWIRRDSGQYWPSICHFMPAAGISLDFNKESGRVVVGLGNGTIQEYELSDDLNRIKLMRSYLAHTKKVRAVVFSLEYEWLLSCGNDKYFQWHCTKSGKRLGGYNVNSWCTCLQFDPDARYVFMGDYSGEISVLKLAEEGLKPITSLKGHSGKPPPGWQSALPLSYFYRSVQCLAWDADRKWLYSGSFDQSVIVWDIGGQQGSAMELHGHTEKIQGVALASHGERLFTASEDGVLAIWDMKTPRQETPTWSQSDMCEKCASPFFWNFKQMWDQKIVGVRQHHCRKCGRAVCNKCSDFASALPQLGFEFEVRLCEECKNKVTEEDKVPLASFHDLKHAVNYVSLDLSKGRLLTCGTDRIVKIWDVRELLSSDA